LVQYMLIQIPEIYLFTHKNKTSYEHIRQIKITIRPRTNRSINKTRN